MLSHERCSDQFYKNKDEDQKRRYPYICRETSQFTTEINTKCVSGHFLKEDVGDDNDDYEDDGRKREAGNVSSGTHHFGISLTY